MPLERESLLFRFAVPLLGRMAADLDEARMAEQPCPGMNHAAWLLAHLSVGNDYALKLLGRPAACPPEWHTLFGPGSTPTTNRPQYPGKAELIDTFNAGAEAVLAAAPSATAEQLAGPHSVAFLRPVMPTAGDLVAHLMTTHLAFHVGQMSAWRRAAGYPAVALV